MVGFAAREMIGAWCPRITYGILSFGRFRPGTTEYPLILKNWTHFDRGLPSREVPLTSVRMMAFLFGQSHEKVHLNQNQETPLVVLSNAHTWEL